MEDAQFCVKCGQKLIQPQQKNCNTCGAVVQPETIFCPSCGNKINSKSEKNQKSSPSMNTNSLKSDNVLLEIMWIGWREKGKITAQRGALLFYRDSLVMAKGGSIAGLGLGEMAGKLVAGPIIGTKIGKRMEKDIVNDQKAQHVSKAPEAFLEENQDNFLVKYDDITTINMSFSRFRGGGKIQINTNYENYEYTIQDYQNYKKYVESLQSIFGSKLIA